jgi:hypothetical protein
MPAMTKKPKKPSQGDSLRTFGAVCAFTVGESAQHPGEIHITQYASELVGPLSVADARKLAANILAACNAIEEGI